VKNLDDEDLKERQRKVQQIHRLALILPWVVVISVLITVLYYVILALVYRYY
jgi:hypothetical protein